MKKYYSRISMVITVLGIFGFLLVTPVLASVVCGSYSGMVTDTLIRGNAVLPGGIQIGDPTKVSFCYDTNTAFDLLPDNPQIGEFRFDPIAPNNWMQLEVNGLIWRSADGFYLDIYDNYTGNPSYILDRFYMGFGDAGSIIFPGYLGMGEIWYYIGADYNPSDTNTPFITGKTLPTSLNDFNLNEVITRVNPFFS